MKQQISIRRKTAYGLAALATLACAFLVWNLVGTGTDDLQVSIGQVFERKTRPPLSDSEVRELFSDLYGYRLRQGKAYRYHFRRTVRGILNDKPVVDAVFAGSLWAHVLKADGAGTTLLAQLEFQSMEGVEFPAQGQPAMAVRVRIDRQGRAIETHFRTDVTPETRRIVKDIVGTWLVQLPESPEVARREPDLLGGLKLNRLFRRAVEYSMTLSDLQGRYLAAYTFPHGIKESLRIEIRKEKYLQSSMPIEIERSAGVVRWALGEGHPLVRTIEERFQAGPSEMRMETQLGGEYRLANIIDSPLSASELEAYTQSVALYQVEYQGRLVVAGSAPPWPELRSRLMAITPTSTDDNKRNLFNDLCNSLRRSPEAVSAALQELRSYRRDSEQFGMVLGALGYAGSPTAQAGLRELYQTGKSAEDRSAVVTVFTMIDRPITPESRDFLLQSAGQGDSEALNSQIDLAIGSSLRHAQPEQRSEGGVRSYITKKWNAAGSTAARRAVLQIIGNSGDPHFFDLLAGVRDPDLRGDALFSMRFMDSDRVRSYLLEVLVGRDDASVRLQAANALYWQTWRPSFEKPIHNCVKMERVTPLRKACADVALGYGGPREEMVRLLVSVEDTGDDTFREYVRAARAR